MQSFSVLVMALSLGLGASMAIMPPFFRESDFGLAPESTENISADELIEAERLLAQFDNKVWIAHTDNAVAAGSQESDKEVLGKKPKPTKKTTSKPRPTSAKPTTKKSSLFKCLGNGFFSDPVDCQAYYQCTNMIPTHKRCDSNLYWDESYKSCNYKQYVTCYQ
uniref:Chitin-binding type-2 domain-containing protein n=1 Tax=Panagrellus redivivus TaxID=6233 RepID=A0A7E4UQ88_PANRE